MAVVISLEAYQMAFGVAVASGADEQFAHLFARNFETNVDLGKMHQMFADFSSHPNYIANNGKP